MGTNDLAKETRARLVPGRAPMLGWLSDCVLAAHAYGIDILDGVYNDIADTEGFAAECAQGRDLGFDGKTLIHPNQIDSLQRRVLAEREEIAQARKMIAAFELPENRDKGAIAMDGRMVERMHADMARRTVAIAEAIQERLIQQGGLRCEKFLREFSSSCAFADYFRHPRRIPLRRAARCAPSIWPAIRRKRCAIPDSGEIRGASADLARELAKRLNVPLTLSPSQSPATVIDAVSKGEADIGFVAYAPSRTGSSRVLADLHAGAAELCGGGRLADQNQSPISTAPASKSAAARATPSPCFSPARSGRPTLVETDNTNPRQAKQKLTAREIDAFGANRQRLTNLLQEMPGYRLLPDNIFDVPQTIIVGKGKMDALATVNSIHRRSASLRLPENGDREKRYPRPRHGARWLWLRSG